MNKSDMFDRIIIIYDIGMFNVSSSIASSVATKNVKNGYSSGTAAFGIGFGI